MRFARIFLLLVVTCVIASAEVESAFVRPSTTDPKITDADSFHLVARDAAVPSRNELMLFLPGTGGVPIVYREFIGNAATLGYHAIGLTYPNSRAVGNVCALGAPGDGECHEKVRLETIDGTDRTTLIDVDRTHSIENRVIKLLEHLHERSPRDGWGQFLDGETILWEKIAVAGHSQGAGHAVMIAKNHSVARCCNFAGLDYWRREDRLALWLSDSFVTPVDRIYVLGHQRDELVDFGRLQGYADLIDVTRYGKFVVPEIESARDFRGRHFLATDVETAREQPQGLYHNAVAVGIDTPKDADGTPLLRPVWDYMLTDVAVPVRIEKIEDAFRILFSPGTLMRTSDFRNWSPVGSGDSPQVLPTKTARAGFFRLEEK